MIVAGVMSGTSADGVDVALCRISPPVRADSPPRLELLAHFPTPYAAPVRNAVLAAMDARSTSTAEVARLSWRLGEVYAAALAAAIRISGLKPDLIALHGQTIYHQAGAAAYLESPLRCTWQIGEPAVIAEQLRVPVISDFRTGDLAAGGQGAPLVPMLDLCLYRDAAKNRVLLNLGGIANLTALPAGCDVRGVLAFDTGPANMVIDACMQRLYGRAYDCGGGAGARGHVLDGVLRELLQDSFLQMSPPKSCGREQYGAEFTTHFLALCERERAARSDVIATATAFTAATVLEAYRRFVQPHLERAASLAEATEVFVSGGGAHNAALLRQLRTGFEPMHCSVKTTEDAGGASLGVDAKEAAAFALLGWLSWHGLPGNVPSATGAGRSVILGRLTRV